MRLFRAKCFLANGAGFIHEGQLFLIDDPSKLPVPKGTGDLWTILKQHYEELVSPNVLFPLSKIIKIKEL